MVSEDENERTTEVTLNTLMNVVRREARAFGRRSRGCADVEELVAAGGLGLAQALERSNPDDPGFRVYALQRIRGAMLDYLRQADPLGRSERKAQRLVAQARDDLRAILGREPEAHEIAQAAQLDDVAYEHLRQCEERRQRVAVVNTLRPTAGDSSDVWLARDGSLDPEQAAMHHLDSEILSRLTRQLDDRARLVIERHYFENLALSEISKELGVSPSRASQLLQRSLRKLREISDGDGPSS